MSGGAGPFLDSSRLTAAILEDALGFAERARDEAPDGEALGRRAIRWAFTRLFQAVRDDPGQAHEGLSPRTLADAYVQILDHALVWESGSPAFVRKTRRRRASGSFYTPETLVEPLLEHGLLPTLTKRLVEAGLKEAAWPRPPITQWTQAERRRAEEALLRFRVLDPACGTGAFLLPAARRLTDRLLLLRFGAADVDPSDRSRAAAEVARLVIHGIDADPTAVAIARFSLWLDAGRPSPAPSDFAPNLRVGDALGVDARFDPVDARLDFADVFRGDDPGFDVVLGNPPFANAIEGQVSQDAKARLAERFPRIGGTADLAYYFLERAHDWAHRAGAVALVLPRGVLTARATRDVRRRLLVERPPAFLLAPNDPSLFPGANVFVVLMVLRGGAACVGGAGGSRGKPPAIDAVRIDTDNWWAPLVRPRTKPAALGEPAASFRDRGFDVFASMTAGMAYDLAPHVVDQPLRGALRLVTTGLIDPAGCGWGKRTCRYLRRDFRRPVIQEGPELPPMIASRLAKVRRPKILVAGLSHRVEAFLDRRGIYGGAVSTYTIVQKDDELVELARLADYLNSPAATERLFAELGAHAMGGGRITLTKAFLRQMFS